MSDLLKKVGPASVSLQFSGEHVDRGAHLEEIAKLLLQVLKREHPCQGEDAFEDEDDGEDYAELDGLVIAAAADVVAALSMVLGQQFTPFFETYFPLIFAYCGKNSSSERSMAVGVFAECCDGLESGVTKFTNDLMNLFIQALRDEDNAVKSNAAFGIGMLITNSQQDTSNYFSTILGLLSPLFASASKSNLIDNICGCLSRMILKAPASLPLNDILPVILKSLPLKNDFAENRPVYKMIIIQLANNNQFVI